MLKIDRSCRIAVPVGAQMQRIESTLASVSELGLIKQNGLWNQWEVILKPPLGRDFRGDSQSHPAEWSHQKAAASSVIKKQPLQRQAPEITPVRYQLPQLNGRCPWLLMSTSLQKPQTSTLPRFQACHRWIWVVNSNSCENIQVQESLVKLFSAPAPAGQEWAEGGTKGQAPATMLPRWSWDKCLRTGRRETGPVSPSLPTFLVLGFLSICGHGWTPVWF